MFLSIIDLYSKNEEINDITTMGIIQKTKLIIGHEKPNIENEAVKLR